MQWQEVYMLLLAVHETLLRKDILTYDEVSDSPCIVCNHIKFTKWLNDVNNHSNKDQTSRFWSGIISFLSAYVGYYFSVRSGNWLL